MKFSGPVLPPKGRNERTGDLSMKAVGKRRPSDELWPIILK